MRTVIAARGAIFPTRAAWKAAGHGARHERTLAARTSSDLVPLPERHTLWRRRALCALFGHSVYHLRSLYSRSAAPVCACGVSYLHRDRETRIRHTVSCFLFGHTYVPVGERDAHHEYVCIACGHPLLFTKGGDPIADRGRAKKRVRYACNLFGHRVHFVSTLHGWTEHACFCGHSFLNGKRVASRITHPLACLFLGHFVSFVTIRKNYAEYRCRTCGHTFSFQARRKGADEPLS